VVPPVDLTTPVAFTVASGTPGGSVPGEVVAVVTGGVLSSFTVTETLVLRPAMFVAEQVKVVPAVSAVTVLLVQPVLDVMLDPGEGSVTLQLTVTGDVLFQPAALGAGVTVGTITGGVLSSLIVTEVVVVRPAPFVAAHVITVPAVSVEMVVAPHPVLLAMPDPGSETAHVTVVLALFQPAALGAGVTVGTTTGGDVSSLTVTELVAVKPAMLVAVQVKVVPAVSAVTVLVVQPLLDVTLEPGEGSVTLQLTVTGDVLFQPAPFGVGLTVGTMTGGVLSMLMLLAVATALTLPALSVQVPLADSPAPSVLRTTGAVQLAIPERASVPVKVTVTFVLFQPAPFGAGEAAAVAEGGVMSILMVADTEPERPAPSTAVHVNVVPGVSAASVTGSQPVVRSELTPEIGSVTVQFKVTFVLFQPAAFGAGVMTGTMVGGRVSILTVTDAEAVAPLLSVAVHVNVVPPVSADTVELPQPVLEAIPVG
jgi:hypothetical protein